MKKDILKKGKKFNVKVIIALITSVVAVSAIGIGLGVGLSGSDGNDGVRLPKSGGDNGSGESGNGNGESGNGNGESGNGNGESGNGNGESGNGNGESGNGNGESGNGNGESGNGNGESGNGNSESGNGNGGSETESQVVSNIDDLKARLESLPNDPIEIDNYIGGTSELWFDVNDSFFTNIIHKPIIQISSELEVQYRSNNLLFDGVLTVEFRIRKRGDTEWINLNSYSITVTGITQYKLKTDFDNFVPKILNRNNENGLFEVETDWGIARTKYFSGPYDDSLYYISSVRILPLEGETIKKDGNVIIKFEVTTDQNKQYVIPMEFKVGEETWDAKGILENLNYGEIESENGITATNGWTNLDEFFTTIGKEKPANLPANSDIQYKIDSSITTNGELVVDFRYRRKDITDDMWTTISSQYKVQVKVLGN